MLAHLIAFGVFAPAEIAVPVEPLTIAEVRRNLRLADDTTEDLLLEDLIVAAREHVENYTGLILTRRQVVATARGFDRWIDLTAWPIASIDAVAYMDRAGAEVALDMTQVMVGLSRPARLTLRQPVAGGDVRITVTAGYATPSEVPAALKRAMHIVISCFYEDRSGGLTDMAERAVEGLCRSFRLMRI